MTWDDKSFDSKLRAMESLGFTQGDAIKLASVQWDNFTESMQKSLTEVEDEYSYDCPHCDAKMEDEMQFEKHVDTYHKDGEVTEGYDYNNIRENELKRTKYQCEFCSSGYKSNESLSVHLNDVHAQSLGEVDGYSIPANESSYYTKENITTSFGNGMVYHTTELGGTIEHPEDQWCSSCDGAQESKKAKEFQIGPTMICPVCNKEIDVGNSGEDGQGLDYNNVNVAWDGAGTYSTISNMEQHIQDEHTPADFGMQDHPSLFREDGTRKWSEGEAWEDWKTGNQLYDAFHDSFPAYDQRDVHLQNMDTTRRAGVTTYNDKGHRRFDDQTNTPCPNCGEDELFDKSGRGIWGKDVYCQSCGWEGDVGATSYGESKANEDYSGKQLDSFFDYVEENGQEYATCRLCGDITYFTDDSPSEQPNLGDHLENVHGLEYNYDINGYESKAQELFGQNDPDEILGGSWGTPENTAQDLYNMTSHDYDRSELEKWQDIIESKIKPSNQKGRFSSNSLDLFLRNQGTINEDIIYDLVMQYGGGYDPIA